MLFWIIVIVFVLWLVHDVKKCGAEVSNSSILHNYLDQLVKDHGWTKSKGLIPTYTAPNGEKGLYTDWEYRVTRGQKKTHHLTYTDLDAFFRMYEKRETITPCVIVKEPEPVVYAKRDPEPIKHIDDADFARFKNITSDDDADGWVDYVNDMDKES